MRRRTRQCPRLRDVTRRLDRIGLRRRLSFEIHRRAAALRARTESVGCAATCSIDQAPDSRRLRRRGEAAKSPAEPAACRPRIALKPSADQRLAAHLVRYVGSRSRSVMEDGPRWPQADWSGRSAGLVGEPLRDIFWKPSTGDAPPAEGATRLVRAGIAVSRFCSDADAGRAVRASASGAA